MSKRVRAAIIEDGKILLIHRIKKTGNYYMFPGGGIEETDKDEICALKRECKEELGVEVNVEEYFDIAETVYLGQEQTHLFYFCRITGGMVGTGDGPEFQDNGYYEGEHIPKWLSIEEFKENEIRPEIMKDKILKLWEKE